MRLFRLALVMLGLLGALVVSPAGAASSADSIVAVVGDRIILESEVRLAADFLRLASPDTGLTDSAIRAAVIQRMIDDYVLGFQAEQESITVEPSEVADEVAASIEQVIERFGDEESYRAALAAEGLTEKGLRQRYEEEARRKLLARRLLDKAGLTQIYISPGEVERFYNENKDSIARVPGQAVLAHMLFIPRPPAQVESAGMRRMTEIMDVLARGGDFATVASSFSEDRATASRGGDWGWKSLADLSPDIATVASQLTPGQTAPPFRTRDGFILLRLEEKRGERVRLRSILVQLPVTRADSLRARERALEVRRKLLAGASFDSLARLYSEDPSTADSGGFLGCFMIDGLSEPFRTVVSQMQTGDVSEPVLSEHGYHLVKAIVLQPEREMSYLEMQDELRNYLYQQKLSQRLQEYLSRISKKVFIRRYG